MSDLRTPWFRAGAAVLLLVILSACTRSADTVMTPLPSAPPPTATSVATTPTVTATKAATATQAPQPTATASPTETPPLETATATKAVPAGGDAGEDACGKALPSRLKVNGYAYVNPDPPLPNNLRREAGANNELVGVLQPGQAMKVLDGPKCVDGWLWWDVNALDSEQNGWTAEGDEQTYWLIPCASEDQCGSQ